MISFKTSKKDTALIAQIARRASRMAEDSGQDYPFMTAQMDVTACHANGMPLRLADLNNADDFNFAHDVFGIQRHLNRQTGKLGDCFVPRFSSWTHHENQTS